MTFDRILNGLGVALFLFSAAVQLNDPDPVRWITVYAVTAVICGWAAANRSVPLPVTLTWGLLTAAVAIGLLAFWEGESHPMPGFPPWAPLNEEVVREALGLGLCSLWSLSLALWEARRTRVSAPASR
jgi:hypothetical protein